MKFQFDRNKNKVLVTGDNYLLDKSIRENEKILRLVKEKCYSRAKNEAKVIGFTKAKFRSKSCSEGECLLYNMMTEAMVFTHVQSLATVPGRKYWTDASIAMIADPGYDVGLGDTNGNITVSNVYTLLARQHKHNIIEVIGQTIVSALEHSANYFAAKAKKGSLHVFGVRVEYNLSSSTDNRVKSVQVLCAECLVPKYEPLIKSQVYKIIIPNSLYGGAYGYKFQEDRNQHRRKFALDDILTLLNYIESKKLINAKLEGRIKFIETKKNNF